MATVRQDEIQLRVDFITDESRRLAKTIQDTKGYNQVLSASQKELERYRKEVEKAGQDETKRSAALLKVAEAEQKVAVAMNNVVNAGKEASKIDLGRVAPAQLTERARQLADAMKRIPQSNPEFKALEAELQRVNAQLGTLRNNAKGINLDAVQSGGTGGGFIGSITGKVAVAFAAVQAFFGVLRSVAAYVASAFAAGDEALKQDAALKSRLQSTNAAAKISFEELIGVAEDLDDVTLFDDDQVKRGEELLLTFTNIKDEVYEETIPVLLDLSTTMKQDISTSAVQVGKALNDPIAGLKALSRIGVTFSAEQKQTIETMVKMGDVAGAQRVILAELRKEFGGSARAAAEAGAGGYQQLTKRLGEIKETIGGALIAVLDRLSPVINFVVGEFEKLADVITDVFSIPVSEKLREQQTEFNALIGVLQNANTKESEREAVIKKLKEQYPGYLKFVGDDAQGQLDLARTLLEGNKLFEQRIFLQATAEENAELIREKAKATKELTSALAEQEKVKQSGVGKRGGVIRNDAGDLNAAVNITTNADIAVQALRDKVKSADNAIQALLQNANATSLREYGQSLNELEASINKTNNPGQNENNGDGGGGGKPTKPEKVNKDAQAAIGSLEYLRDLISKLEKEISATPGDSKALEPLILQLKQAEFQLAELEAKLEQIKNPKKAVSEDQQILNELAGGAAPAGPFDITQAQREAAVEYKQFVTDEYDATLAEMDAKDLERDDRQRELDKQRIEDMKALEIEAAGTIANTLFSIQRNQLETRTQEETSALDKEYKQKIAAAEGNAHQQAKLQKEYEKKKAAIEKEAARERKEIAFKEAIIQVALNILRAVGPVARLRAAIDGAAQVALIAFQKFEHGGIVQPHKAKFGLFGGRPHSAGGTRGYFDDGTTIEVERDEAFAVVNKRNAHMLRLLSRINSAGGHGVPFFEKGGVPRFADGGLPAVNTTPAASLFPVVPGASSDAGSAQLLEAAKFILQAAREMPRRVKADVVYFDLEDAAAEIGAVRDDAAL